MNEAKIRVSAVFLLMLLGSAIVLPQGQQTVSESRTSLMNAENPYAYMVNRLKRLSVPIKELNPYDAFSGEFFILPGTNAEEMPGIAFVAPMPERGQDYWPQAVWLSCFDARASGGQMQSALFVLIPPKAEVSAIIAELAQFETLRLIVLFENSTGTPLLQLKSASKSGQISRSVLVGLYPIFNSEGLPWSESPAASFLLRSGYQSDTGLLAGFHEQGLPALSILVNPQALNEPEKESRLLAALSKLEVNIDAPEVGEYNYLNLSTALYHGTISERSLLIFLISCLFILLASWFFIPNKGIEKIKIAAVLLNGLIQLIIFFAIAVIFAAVSSILPIAGIRTTIPGFIFFSLVFSLFMITAFSIYFSVLSYLKHTHEFGYAILFFLLFDTLFFAIFYFPVSPYFSFCALLFWLTRHKTWISATACLALSALMALVLALNSGMTQGAFQAFSIMRQSAITSLILFPFFLWISVVIKRVFSSRAIKWLAIGTAVSMAMILGFMFFAAWGNLL